MELQWELAQIQNAGPSWKEAAAAESIAAEPGAGGEGGGVATGDVGVDGGVPEFGGGEATEGEIPDVAEPVEPAAEV